MSKDNVLRPSLLCCLSVLCLLSCLPQRKLSHLREEGTTALLSMGNETGKDIDSLYGIVNRDTVMAQDFDGHKVLIMRAIKDEDGNMTAHDVINASVVSARFRNVAERQGRVDLEFQIRVPKAMQDSEWQLRFYPEMRMCDDSVALEPVIISGSAYRKAQLRAYERYRRFLDRIVSDTTVFINLEQLEIFIERNMPGLYRFKNDSSFVSEECFASAFGVTEQEAMRHYMNKWRLNGNRRRMAMREKMYGKYVKVPITDKGLRLDSVIHTYNGDFVYNYVQTLEAKAGLKKVDIILSGEIYEGDRCVYRMPEAEPLTFYISSLAALADYREKYLSRVVERRVEENTACYIDFRAGSCVVEEEYGENAGEMDRIKSNLLSLMENREFDMDSIVVTAFASPEGDEDANLQLARRRAGAICAHFRSWMEGKNTKSGGMEFISRSHGENWTMFEALVREDGVLTSKDREVWRRAARVGDADRREEMLHEMPNYLYLRREVYPRLRTVKFDFHLHRKGMVKDTVHTTELDSAYMAGLEALRAMDYHKAVTLLRPYGDYNSAVAYLCLAYEASALEILEKAEKTAKVNYLLAVLYSRRGNERKALRHYMQACTGDRSMVHRGNLDPEISRLKHKYLNNNDYEQ